MSWLGYAANQIAAIPRSNPDSRYLLSRIRTLSIVRFDYPAGGGDFLPRITGIGGNIYIAIKRGDSQLSLIDRVLTNVGDGVVIHVRGVDCIALARFDIQAYQTGTDVIAGVNEMSIVKLEPDGVDLPPVIEHLEFAGMIPGQEQSLTRADGNNARLLRVYSEGKRLWSEAGIFRP